MRPLPPQDNRDRTEHIPMPREGFDAAVPLCMLPTLKPHATHGTGFSIYLCYQTQSCLSVNVSMPGCVQHTTYVFTGQAVYIHRLYMRYMYL
jgi:hypothetical protein